MRQLILRIAMIGVVIGLSPAFGQENEVLTPEAALERAEVERLSTEGVAAYRAKEYARAIELFQQALAIQPVSNLLYNIARASDLMGNPKRAKLYYEKFMARPDITESQKAKARGYMVALNLPPERPQEPNQAWKDNDPTVRLSSSSGLDDIQMVLGWTSLGLGVVALGTGTTLGIQAQSEADAFGRSDDLAVKNDLEKNARSLALSADITFGLGAVLLGTGVTLLVLDYLDEAEVAGGSSFHLSPAVTPESAGVFGTVRF